MFEFYYVPLDHKSLGSLTMTTMGSILAWELVLLVPDVCKTRR
jgi:hypothetical protein